MVVLSRIPLLAALTILVLNASCTSRQESHDERLRRLNRKGEYVYRESDKILFPITPPPQQPREPYPWSSGSSDQLLTMNLDHFRCKGSSSNPPRIEYSKNGQPQRYVDCGGGHKHSLPMVGDKEYIASILIELLNEVHMKTGLPVVVTCGHRCPVHNAYSDSSPQNRSSKHQIGAEVDFYVQGMEDRPKAVVDILVDYYRNNPKFSKEAAYRDFQRYDKPDAGVSTPPWYNKEVFIKVYLKNEGRDFDNRHPYPYISLQARYDRSRQERVIFSWETAQKGYRVY